MAAEIDKSWSVSWLIVVLTYVRPAPIIDLYH